jgi:hypothetical protein
MEKEKLTLSQLEQYLSKADWILKGPVDAYLVYCINRWCQFNIWLSGRQFKGWAILLLFIITFPSVLTGLNLENKKDRIKNLKRYKY